MLINFVKQFICLTLISCVKILYHCMCTNILATRGKVCQQPVDDHRFPAGSARLPPAIMLADVA